MKKQIKQLYVDIMRYNGTLEMIINIILYGMNKIYRANRTIDNKK